MSTEKKLWVITLVFIGAFAYGVWNLFQPDAFPISFVRGEAREAAPGVIVGPYPTDDELRLLKNNGVTEVVSLMHPESAVESALVAEEARLVASRGMRFMNFPMDFKDMKGAESASSLARAVDRIRARGEAKLYVHCYLGRHRVALIEAALRGAPAQAAGQPISASISLTAPAASSITLPR